MVRGLEIVGRVPQYQVRPANSGVDSERQRGGHALSFFCGAVQIDHKPGN